MSEDAGTDGDGDEAGVDAVGLLGRWYHVPVLLVGMVITFWSRFQNRDAFRGGGDVQLQAIDSWYHWRATNWTVDNFPSLLGFDPWTGFPDGTIVGQFGTLFDLIVATVAYVVALGDPGQSDVLWAALFTVPALSALVLVPTYLVGKRVGNRFGGLVGAVALSLFTGQWLFRTTAGQLQHHVAELLFMMIAVLAVLLALDAAERERPIWEFLRSGELAPMRETLVYSILAGLAMTVYMLVWPPGVVLVGIFGVYLVVQLTLDYLQGRPPDHVAVVGVTSMLVVAAGTAAAVQEPGLSATSMDYFAPVFALLVAGGTVFMAALARGFDARDLDRRLYPVTVAGSIVVTVLALAVVLPGVFETLIGNVTGRLVPFGRSESALTVQEVEPPETPLSDFNDSFGLAFFVGLGSLALAAFRPVLVPEKHAKHLFVGVWALTLISMALTQVRFGYYLAVGVAVMTAHVAGFLTAGLEVPSSPEEIDDISAGSVYQVLGGVLVVVLVFGTLLGPVASSPTPLTVGENTRPGADAAQWDESLEWLTDNTPEVGNYGDANNTDALEFSGDYAYPEGGSFDYPAGSYGVLSWWDYGHLITNARRIPHANPFQQNARSASAVLTAQGEREAELFLDAIAGGTNPTHESDESDLREAAGRADGEPGIRYVMIDDASAGGKFGAITQWTGPGFGTYLEEVGSGPGPPTFAPSDSYDETLISQLYLDDANGMESFRLVHESSQYSVHGVLGGGFRTLPAGTWDQPGLGLGENISTLGGIQEQFQTLRSQGQGLPIGNRGQLRAPRVVSSVKTFERVEGATLTGQANASANVTVTLEGIETSSGRTFDYEQETVADETGRFEVTVPYPTDDSLGPADGYADAAVSVDDGYEVLASGATAFGASNVTVPESAVQTGETVAVELESSG